ncbi:MAG: biotin--[acetyl-CoA-carboxylase] ligase [Bacteroidota bacterium]
MNKFGTPRYHFETLSSTNDYAAQLIRECPPVEGTVITTAHQSAGRGQHQRAWVSDPGENIMMTLITRPTWLVASNQFVLNQVTSMAVADVVIGYGCHNVSVKWPNDVYIGVQKVAGILINNQIQGSHLRSSIMGIGMNINQRTWPNHIPNATSLSNQLNQDHSVEEVLTLVLQRIVERYHQARISPKELRADYRDMLYLRDVHAMYVVHGLPERGTIKDVDPLGRLVVETTSGFLSLAHGEIQFPRS